MGSIWKMAEQIDSEVLFGVISSGVGANGRDAIGDHFGGMATLSTTKI